MSQPNRRRAAFGAALVGVLVALTSSLGIASPVATSTVVRDAASVPTSASYAATSTTLDHAAVRTAHAKALGSTASHRSYGGPGFVSAPLGIALLLLAGGSLLVAVRRWQDPTSWRSVGAVGPRAPPRPAAC